jgi:O-antigen ligase
VKSQTGPIPSTLQPESGGERFAALAHPLGLAGLMILMAFEAGGYLPDATGWAAAGLAATLAVGALALGRPPTGLTRPLAWAGGLLALFGVWVLLSATWSDATAAALIEFDRVLLYLFALLLFGVARWPEHTLERLPAAFVFAAVVVCGAGLLTRLLPGQWPFALPPPSRRLDYPVGYENALGVLASLGIVFALHLASWPRQRAVTRVLAAAALPALAVALVLTFSRGATLVAVIGPLAYLALGRPRGAFTALIATGPFVLLAALATLDADLLARLDSRTPAAVEQGEDLAVITVAASVGAAALLGLLLRVEPRLMGSLPGLPRRRPGSALLAGLAVAAVAAVGVAGATGELGEVYESIVGRGSDGEQGTRERLIDPSSVADLGAQSRPRYWRVALDAFEDDPVRGSGAGTYARLWARDRKIEEEAAEAHSLYFETLAELGLVGGVLLLASLGALLWPALARIRGRDRPIYACMLAASLTWLVHAGLDWDWEMPVITLWLFAMGGCALAASGRRADLRGRRSWPWRALVAVGMVTAALTPAAIALSQTRIDGSVEALRHGDCPRAERLAGGSISVIGLRPEPYEVLAYCKARRGDHLRAAARMRQALERDPHNWRLFYGLALVRATAARDPRPALGRARAQNPRDRIIGEAERMFSTDDPRVWRRLAPSLPRPLPDSLPP